MESIGEKLKTARVEKGYSPDQVARDTNIARRFILAMEGEDFEVFPGDTYLIGFLRNYADYLGLDPDRIINLYRNMKIQEQPIPMDALIKGRRKLPGPKVILLGLLALIVLGGAGFGVFSLLDRGPQADKTAAEEPSDVQTGKKPSGSYEMTDEIVARRFSTGQSIIVHLSEGKIPLSIQEIGEDVVLLSPSDEYKLGLGESLSMDLTLDGVEDLLIEVQDIDSLGGTAVIRFDRGVGRATEATEAAEAAEIAEAADTEDTAENREQADIGGEPEVAYTETSSAPGREQKIFIINTSEEREPFRLNVVFRGYSLVRYVKDNDVREQRYFNKDDTFQLDVNSEVMLWISNAGTFKAKISGKDISFGRPGEVTAKLIRWEKEENTGLYQLKMFPVY